MANIPALNAQVAQAKVAQANRNILAGVLGCYGIHDISNLIGGAYVAAVVPQLLILQEVVLVTAK
ncbi:MAG: hypothetical protein LBB21_03245 [Holosporaceae bacterium]|nr:hypothetical protein [Holosporaceae bacterium]